MSDSGDTHKEAVPSDHGLEVVPSDAPILQKPLHSDLQVVDSTAAEVLPDHAPNSPPEAEKPSDVEDVRPKRPRRRCCGLSWRAWAWIALAVAVVASVLGGTLGALSMGDHPSGPNRGSENVGNVYQTSSAPASTSNSTSPSSTSSAVTSGSTGIASMNCTSGSRYKTGNATFFEVCGVNWPIGTGAGGVQLKNLDTTISYSFEGCMTACDVYNRANDNACQAVTYMANLDYALDWYAGNCIFKNVQGVDKSTRKWISSAYITSDS